MASKDIQELSVFILDKFRYPNVDMRYLGGSSSHMQLQRDIMRTINKLAKSDGQPAIHTLLGELKGQVMALHAVSYYSETETDEIMTKIEKAEV